MRKSPWAKNSEENGDGNEGANRRTGGGNGGQRAAGGNARVRDQAKPMHGHEDTVDAGEGNPEVKFTSGSFRRRPKSLGPEKQCAKNCERGRDAHNEMEMAGDEIVADGSGGEILAGEENAGESAGEKK